MTLAGPAQAVPDPGTAASSTSALTHPDIGPVPAISQEAAEGIAVLRANLTRVHGGDHHVTIWFDEDDGISVQRGSYAGRVTEYG
jgi:hypothetical protein